MFDMNLMLVLYHNMIKDSNVVKKKTFIKKNLSNDCTYLIQVISVKNIHIILYIKNL